MDNEHTELFGGDVSLIPFGDLKIGPLARRKIAEALDRNWVTE